MGYTAMLTDKNGDILHTNRKHNYKGSTYVLGGTTALELDITYNYSNIFKRVLGVSGLRGLDGLTASETLNRLQEAIYILGDDIDLDDYWNPTEGNIKTVLCQLRDFAALRPDGIWRILN